MDDQNVQATSPLPPKRVEVESIKLLDFYDALREIASGKKAFRKEWEKKNFYGFLDGEGRLSLHDSEGKIHQWIVSDGDMNGTDWVII